MDRIALGARGRRWRRAFRSREGHHHLLHRRRTLPSRGPDRLRGQLAAPLSFRSPHTAHSRTQRRPGDPGSRPVSGNADCASSQRAAGHAYRARRTDGSPRAPAQTRAGSPHPRFPVPAHRGRAYARVARLQHRRRPPRLHRRGPDHYRRQLARSDSFVRTGDSPAVGCRHRDRESRRTRAGHLQRNNRNQRRQPVAYTPRE